jgi:hypothetical protein
MTTTHTANTTGNTVLALLRRARAALTVPAHPAGGVYGPIHAATLGFRSRS